MPRFLIEREIPGIGSWGPGKLQKAAARSCEVLRGLGPDIQWLTSYVTDDRLYCVYIAASPELIQKHAALGGFPCNRISEVRAVIDPTTAEAVAR
ncbi:MAG TPA: DUF4242 domain-containing protein [Methylomirabilota bacterium]|jgi:hypothetical protein